MRNKTLIIAFFILLVVVAGFYFTRETQEDITLHLYAHNEAITDEIIESFQEDYPYVSIKRYLIPKHNDRLAYVSDALNAPDQPVDIVDTDIVWTYTLAKNDLVIPLDDYFTSDELNVYLSSPLEGNIINNQLYGIPYRTDTGILYYRKDLLEKYNQPVPTTFKELMDTYNIIKNTEDIHGYAGSWYPYEGLTCNAMELLWTYGGSINLNSEANIINTPENKAAFKKIKKLIDDGLMHPEVMNFKSGDLRDAFIAGELLFMRDWPAGWDKIQNSEESVVKDQVGITYLPLGIPNGDNSGALGGWQMMVSEKSEHPEESIAFIKHFTNYENNKSLILSRTYLPVRKDLYDDPQVIEEMPFIKRNLELFNNSRHRPFHKDYVEFSQIYIDQVTKYFKGELSLEEFLEDTEYKMHQIIE